MSRENTETNKILKKAIKKLVYYAISFLTSLILVFFSQLWWFPLILVIIFYLILDFLLPQNPITLRDLIVVALTLFFYKIWIHTSNVVNDIEERDGLKTLEREAREIFE